MSAYQGYLEIKHKSMDEEEFNEFTASLKEVGVDFYRVGERDDEYYHCLVQDPDVLKDLLKSLSGRSPVIQGMWDRHGTPKGKEKKVDEETGEVTYSGDAEYSFDLSKHLKHSKKVNEETGEKELETKFKPLHCFMGWEACTEY